MKHPTTAYHKPLLRLISLNYPDMWFCQTKKARRKPAFAKFDGMILPAVFIY